MNIKPIRTDADYRAMLTTIEGVMSAVPDSEDGERLDVLVTLVEAWEREHFPMDLPDPIDAIRFAMEQQGLTVKDLEAAIGRPNRVYEVLGRKRALTVNMIWKLHEQLRLPAEALIKPIRKVA
jgi:HTH-type transcriptional regulator/antitoxin HigA